MRVKSAKFANFKHKHCPNVLHRVPLETEVCFYQAGAFLHDEHSLNSVVMKQSRKISDRDLTSQPSCIQPVDLLLIVNDQTEALQSMLTNSAALLVKN